MPEKPRRFPIGIVIGLSALVVATGGATAFFTWKTSENKPTPVVTPSTQPTPSNLPVPAPPSPSQTQASPKVTSPAAEKVAQVYWVRDRATDLEFVPTPVETRNSDRAEVQIAAAMNRLLEAPPNKDLTTTIPQGTKLRNLQIKSNNIYVDLSQAFTTGGGSVSMQGRLAQILYTASSLDPNARVYLSVEGQPLKVLGGEGLIVDQPLTRRQFEQGNGVKTE
jgi:spore germination protein GerM